MKKIFAAAALVVVVASAGAQNLTGAGATFPNPIYSKWFSEFTAAHPDVHINYQAVGSGAGITQVTNKTVDFGASDAILTDDQLNKAKANGVYIFMLPTVMGGVVPIYNVPGVSGELKFSGDVMAEIYLGKITKWNDPKIKAENPGVNFPDKAILPVYRSEGSGTTFIFTDYLSKVSPDFEKTIGRAASVKWPVGVGAKGSDGVAAMVSQTSGAFGYDELIYAANNHIEFGSVKNSAGKYLKASTASISAAAAASVKTIPDDFRVSITNAPGNDSYPIASFTWLLIPNPAADPAKGKALQMFLTWMLDKGESEAAALYYAPLPKAVADKERAAIKYLK